MATPAQKDLNRLNKKAANERLKSVNPDQAEAGSKRKTNESKEEADARRETDKYRARKRRGIETEEEGNKRREENAAR